MTMDIGPELAQFNEALAAVVHELETALETNAEFIEAIETARLSSELNGS